MSGSIIQLADPHLTVRVWEDDEVPQLAEYVRRAWTAIPRDERQLVATWIELHRSPKEKQPERLRIQVVLDPSRSRVAWTDATRGIVVAKPVVPEMLQQGRLDLVIGSLIHEFAHFVLAARAGEVGEPGESIEERVDNLLTVWGLPVEHREECEAFLLPRTADD